jgi:hypothetical protein
VPLSARPEIWAPRCPDGPAGPVQESVRRRVAALCEPSHRTHAVDGYGCTAWYGGAGAGSPAGTVLADVESAGGRVRLTCPTDPWIAVAASSIAARGGTPTSSSGANPANPLSTPLMSPRLRYGSSAQAARWCHLLLLYRLGRATLLLESDGHHDIRTGSATTSRRSCSMVDPHAILRSHAATHGRMRKGMWDLVFLTSTHHPSSPRRRSVPSTPPAGTPGRPNLPHGGHDGGGHTWRR